MTERNATAPPNARHVVDGRAVWGTTDVISAAGCGADFSTVPPRVLEAAIARGNAVHAAVHLLAEGDLDRATVDPSIAGYIAAYEKFVADTEYTPIVAEVPMYCPTYEYAGIPDQLGWLGARRIIFDLKTAFSLHPGPVALQLAAYHHLCDVMWPDEPLDGVYVFQPRANGTYRFRPLSTDRAWRIFLYCLRYVRGEAADWEIREIGIWLRDGRAVGGGV